jgi:glycosyltransferase involved in cell wall biosynthesis
MKIAIIGTRGIPAQYSGYDTLAEELALRLANDHKAHVTVYCRSPYYEKRPPRVSSVECVYLPSGRVKGIESVFHTGLSAMHALTRRYDVIFVVDPGNAPWCLLFKWFGKKVVIHTDGLGWKRGKWGRCARLYYKWAERISVLAAAALVSDNPVMKDYYRDNYGAETVYIPYGAEPTTGMDEAVLSEIPVKPHRYLLVVARLEPENNTDLIIREYVASKVELPLVVVGDSPYGKGYLSRLHSLADDRVYFAGRIFDQKKLNGLYQYAFLYIHGHEVGGTNPSLLRAMGLQTPPLVLNVPFNTVVTDGNGFTFEKEEGSLSAALRRLVLDPALVREAGVKAKAWADRRFTWQSVAAAYAELFGSLAGQN